MHTQMFHMYAVDLLRSEICQSSNFTSKCKAADNRLDNPWHSGLKDFYFQKSKLRLLGKSAENWVNQLLNWANQLKTEIQKSDIDHSGLKNKKRGEDDKWHPLSHAKGKSVWRARDYSLSSVVLTLTCEIKCTGFTAFYILEATLRPRFLQWMVISQKISKPHGMHEIFPFTGHFPGGKRKRCQMTEKKSWWAWKMPKSNRHCPTIIAWRIIFFACLWGSDPYLWLGR